MTVNAALLHVLVAYSWACVKESKLADAHMDSQWPDHTDDVQHNLTAEMVDGRQKGTPSAITTKRNENSVCVSVCIYIYIYIYAQNLTLVEILKSFETFKP